jgi:trehalose 6-phosphate synthase
MSAGRRLIVVSNRLPITVQTVEDELQLQPSSGGLVSALAPILADSGGCWVGWTGAVYDPRLAELVNDWCLKQTYSFGQVFLTASERDRYYRGFSNQTIWPLFHGLLSRCQFGAGYWESYRKVNEKFANTVEQVSRKGDFIWVHDYHLMMVAETLRTRGLGNRLAYFHHIPFPPPDIFEALPWRVEVLRALMRFDLIGFQTARDQHNFIACLRRCMSHARVWDVRENLLVHAEGYCTTAGVYPISIDYEKFAADAADSAVDAASRAIRDRLPGTRIILGVDRLDYTKGILERLIAFERLLESKPELRGRVSMLQIVIPSREEIPEYSQLRLRIETLISRINGGYSNPGWVPIHHFYRSVSRNELIAFYRAADVAVVTPLKDGMNLIAKEFCASRIDNRGVLVLSEFAGAAEELKCGALLVNPHDTETLARVLALALRMDESEQRMRMERMRSRIREHDVFHWSRSFSKASASIDISLLLRDQLHETFDSANAIVGD